MMRRGLLNTLGLIVFGVIALGTSPAQAKTIANGPYYATPSWDQTLPVATRFIVLSNMGSNAVLDRETGLVWEKSPSTGSFGWILAHDHCDTLTTGGRFGWRLPALAELASLADPSVAYPALALPSGHPFINVQPLPYWSANSAAIISSDAMEVYFSDSGGVNRSSKNSSRFVWCVRGGQGVDPQSVL